MVFYLNFIPYEIIKFIKNIHILLNSSTFLLMSVTFEGFTFTFVSSARDQIQEFVRDKEKKILDIRHTDVCLELILVMHFSQILVVEIIFLLSSQRL